MIINIIIQFCLLIVAIVALFISKDELKTLQTVAERCAEAIELIVDDRIDDAMSRCNS